MISRRDFMMGAMCLAGAGGAYGLKPRHRVSLLGTRKLGDIVPFSFPGWSGRDASDLVAPPKKGDLATRLYGEQVERIYQSDATGDMVMVLMAHGDTQSNELQLHRPEVCYPAFGFEIASNRLEHLQLEPSALLPVRQLVAVAPDRRENIVYWTRLGEFLPTTGLEQQLDRVQTALHGYVADGVLARISMVSGNREAAFALLAPFTAGLIKAVTPNNRSPLIGTRLASILAHGQG